MKNWVKGLISIAAPQVVAAIGAYFTVTGIGSWYSHLNKPSWNPPNYVFGPVWMVLYILMGVSLFLVWKSTATASYKKTAIGLWCIQLLLNLCWSFIFFNQHLIGAAFIEIVFLWIFIVATIIAFSKISRLAAWLLVPYISWVTFAALLTYAVWRLN